jgi:hypothetical protein
MFAWIPNAFVKDPCTREGLRAAEQSVISDIRGQHDFVLLASAGGRRKIAWDSVGQLGR